MEDKRKEILKFENVSLTYHTRSDEILALKKINFTVYEGEFVAIVGPSGCGKTTILSLISGILSPSSGKIFLDGKDINNKTENKKNFLISSKKIELNKNKAKSVICSKKTTCSIG